MELFLIFNAALPFFYSINLALQFPRVIAKKFKISQQDLTNEVSSIISAVKYFSQVLNLRRQCQKVDWVFNYFRRINFQ